VVTPDPQAPALHVPAVVCEKLAPLPEHIAAAHGTDVGVGQVSAPLQKAAGIEDMTSALHMAAAHILVFPHLAHAPPEAHRPVLPQFVPVAAGHRASEVPEVTLVHVPVEPLRLQAWQAPAQAELQHTPSTQFAAVLMQSADVLHMAPCACFVPQTCVTVLQGFPLAQSLAVLQLVRHWVASRHLYRPPPHCMVAGVLQTPPPLQLLTSVRMLGPPVVLSTHDCVPHDCEPG